MIANIAATMVVRKKDVWFQNAFVFDGDMPTVIVAAAIENKYVFSRRMLSSGLNRYR